MQTKSIEMTECNVCREFFPTEYGHLICSDCWQLLTELNREHDMDAYDLIASESFLEEDCQ